MQPLADYRERAIECLELAWTTHNPQTKVWAIQFAALLQRLSTAKTRKSPRQIHSGHPTCDGKSPATWDGHTTGLRPKEIPDEWSAR